MSLQTDERWTARRLATGPPVTGTVVAWGDDTYGQTAVPSGLTDVVAVAAGQFHTLALQPDGTVTAWGRNDSGQADIPAGLGHVVAIATHRDHNLASISDGTVVAWGSNTNGEAAVPQGLTGVVAVAAGSTHSMALRSDGTVVAWGSDLMGQVDVPSGLTDVVAIDAGGHHSVAVKSDGTVVAWGWNRYGQSTLPRCLPASIGVSCTRFGSLVLLADQTLFGWGSDQNGETTIPSTCGVSAFNAGGYHILAIRVDGTLVGWGSNVNRQLDIPPDVNNVLAVAAGFHHSVALIGPTTRAATATALTSNPNPSVFHQPITASATVTPTSATSQTPTGTVDFFIDGFGIDSVPLNQAGTAHTEFQAPEVGTHPLIAIYNGDMNFAGSESGTVIQRVNAGATKTTLTSTPNPSALGQSVTLTANVTAIPPAGGIPVGTVTFTVDSTVLAAVSVDYRGVATTTTSSLTAGTHTLGASFQDSFRYTTSSAALVTQQVNP
ncbi:Ig-like domain repeat protein [Streptomyces antimycoticus]|uniref:Ig-like domain repeat protein n=1 Tax=Streptomyces antimycoticus TaxID=68175 RepID=UPI0037FD0F47